MKKIIVTLVAVVSLFALAGCGNKNVTISLVGNNGAAVEEIIVAQQTTLDAPEITREGYTFVGWFEDQALSIPFDFDTPVVRNITLYAKWSINSYTVTFVYNNGSDNGSVTGTYDTNFVYPETPSKEGYTFLGWYSYVDLTNEYTSNKYTAENFSLYAKWQQNEYTVRFYLEEDDTTPVYTEVVLYGEGVTNIPSIPLVTGQDGAWNQAVNHVTADMDVYLVYTVQTFDVTFLDYSGNTYLTLTVDYGDLIVPTSSPVRTGYDFVGYLNTTTQLNMDLTTYTVTSDITIQDVFQIKTFSVNFFGGESNTLLGTTQFVEYGSDAVAPTTGLERIGYTFTGWNIDFTSVTGELNVYAQYTVNQYTISFEANGGVYSDTTTVKNVVADYNSNVTAVDNPTKDGFVFVGWFDVTLTNEIYFGTGISMPVDGLTVYAKWVELVATTYTVDGVYYFEQEDIALDQLSLEGTFSAVTSQNYIPFVNILYDTNMSPLRTIEGYEFYKFVHNGVEYFDEEQLFTITQDETIDVYYRRIIVTVDFTEHLNNENVTTTYYVYYNGDILNPPTPTPVVGMTVIWEHQVFTNIKSDLDIAAIQYSNSMQTVLFVSNGSIIFMGINDPANPHTLLINGDSPLWTISQNGYRFDGWYIAGTNIRLEIGEIYFDHRDFEEYFTTIEARWVALAPLNEVTTIDMSIDVDIEVIIINFDVLPVSVEAVDVYPTDFQFIVNGVVISSDDVALDSIMNYIMQNGNSFTLSLNSTDPYYAFFRDQLLSYDNEQYVEIPGTHTIQIISIGDMVNTSTSNPSDAFRYEVASVYEGIPQATSVRDYYLIEDFGNEQLRYVFYANLTYQFNGMQFEILTGTNHITANGDLLKTSNIPGEFEFTINNGTETKTYNGLVVSDIRQFNIGDSYQNYLSQMDNVVDNDIFLHTDTATPYYVGANNTFMLDILIRNNTGSRIDLDDVLLDYTFYLNGSATALTEANLATYVTLNGNDMQFTAAAIDQTFDIVVEPRYEATKMNMDPLTYTVMVNDGYNAFTNDQLKDLFADFSVHLINIHRDIKAELYENQLYEDGSPKNFFARPTNDYTNYGNVYYRISGSINNDDLTIEGNYMTIDGSDIQYINALLDGFGNVSYAQAFDVVSVQIGIFYYNVSNGSLVNDSSFESNNLRILGNTTTPSINYGGTEEEIANQERLMSQNSGGMLGVVVREGKAALNNMVIGYTNIGVTTNAHGETSSQVPLTVDMDYITIYDSWANSIYSWRSSGIALTNSEIYGSGGAAVHFDDVNPGTEGYDDPLLLIGENVTFNNWVSGQEAWFKAYGMSSIALQLKSNLNSSVDPLEKTIIQMKTNPVTGLDTEMMNLIFLSLPQNGAVTYENPLDETSVLTASEVSLNVTDAVGTTVLDRSWNFTEELFPIAPGVEITDPRIFDNQYGFALGSLSDTYSFLGMIAEIKTIYYTAYGVEMSDADAGNIASIAGFYNLTAAEALNVAGAMQGYGLSIHDAIVATKGTLDYAQPQYIEVITPIAVTGAPGNVTILIEMYNTDNE